MNYIMKLLLRAQRKLRNIVHAVFFKHFGFGNRVSKAIWEEQFADDTWDYLYSKDEEAHYNKIIEFYANVKGSVLDIGCGQGVLLNYFRESLNISTNVYCGIDISENAIKAAKQRFPDADFKQIDFENTNIKGKYDVIVFNETLYYFNRPLNTLEKCVTQNLNENGHFIISMCDYSNHNLIWNQIDKKYRTIREEAVQNSKGQNWTIKLLQPIR